MELFYEFLLSLTATVVVATGLVAAITRGW